MMRLAAAFLIAAATAAAADPSVPEPQAYHGEPYRSAVPDTLSGATVLDAGKAADWQARGAVMIDVLPAIVRPEGLPKDVIWRAPQHESLPGAVWLAGAGYDRLSPQDEAGFAIALNRLSKADKSAALVFFCKADCWMSWNAARRAVLLGYTQVGWFPGGTDEWAAEGRPLAVVQPSGLGADKQPE